MPGKPRSEDLRVRAIAAVLEEGLSRREAARRFKVGDASVIRWVAVYEESGRTQPLNSGGDKRSKLKPHRDWLLALRRKENDLTLEAVSARLLQEKGVRADASMLSRFFASEGISFKKKTVHASEQERPDVAEARVEWRRMQPDLQGRLIFLDETGARTDMTRRHAWSDVGTRALGRAPGGHWKTTTFLAGLTANGLIAPFVLDGPMDRAAFTEYVRQVLVPELRAGDVVILDNLPGHKGEEAAELVEACGAKLMFLPPYSPDLNPIEMLFSKLKTLLRKAERRTREALWQTIGDLLDAFTPDECANYIRHAGYAS
ncbi:MAG: IS630 family transposase [Hyphomonadaceae bacterium]